MKAILLLTMLLAGGGVAAGAEKAPTFCERLAPQLGLKPVTNGSSAPAGAWRTDPASPERQLFGGMATISLSVTPIGRDPAPETAKACTYIRKGTICRIEGAQRLYVRTRLATVTLDSRENERAEVEVRNTIVLCRDRK